MGFLWLIQTHCSFALVFLPALSLSCDGNLPVLSVSTLLSAVLAQEAGLEFGWFWVGFLHVCV